MRSETHIHHRQIFSTLNAILATGIAEKQQCCHDIDRKKILNVWTGLDYRYDVHALADYCAHNEHLLYVPKTWRLYVSFSVSPTFVL